MRRAIPVLGLVWLTACGSNGPTPTFATITPGYGPKAGGTSVVVTGTGLDAVASVLFGANSVATASASTSSVSVLTPAATAAGVVSVRAAGVGNAVRFVYDPSTWTFVDGGDTEAGINLAPTTGHVTVAHAVAMDDRIYVLWRENASPAAQIRAAVYDPQATSPAWRFVDGGNAGHGLNRVAAAAVAQPFLATAGTTLVACWTEVSATTSAAQVRVAEYGGNDDAPGWTFVDGNGANGINHDVTEAATDPTLCWHDGALHAAWCEPNAAGDVQVRVARRDGSTWTFLDGNGVTGINRNTARAGSAPRLVAHDDRLLAAWIEDSGTAEQVRVAVYDDTDGEWDFLDGGGANGLNRDAAQDAAEVTFLLVDDGLHLAWSEANSGGVPQIRVAAFTGTWASPAWTFVDGNGADGINHDTGEDATAPTAVVLESRTYLAWSERHGGAEQLRVAGFQGGSPAATFVDGGGSDGSNRSAARSAVAPTLVAVDKHVWAVWVEFNTAGIGQVRAARGD